MHGLLFTKGAVQWPSSRRIGLMVRSDGNIMSESSGSYDLFVYGLTCNNYKSVKQFK